jgi:hypothetical protein
MYIYSFPCRRPSKYNARSIAVDRDVESHRRWIIRHVASGLWVSLIRIASPAFALLMEKLGMRRALGDVEGSKLIFALVGITSALSTIGGAELYLHSLDREKALQNEQRALKRAMKK